MPRVIRPTAAIAADVVLTDDPARAMALAQRLAGSPRMANHAHGLWGYSGTTADGRALTVQSTGIGAPSAALVLSDLVELGARRVVRVGPCMALDGELATGATLLCGRALAGDGTSRALGAGATALPDGRLTEAVAGLPGAPASVSTVASTDLLAANGNGPPAALRERWLTDGAVAAEMQTAALFAGGMRLGADVAALSVVTDDAEGRPGPAAKLEEAFLAAADLAARALAG